jgi:hypothetical protein
MSDLLKKYESIDQSKLNAPTVKILEKVKTLTADFTTDDEKNNKIAEGVLNEIMKKNPDAIKIVKREPKVKAKATKKPHKATHKAKSPHQGTSSTPSTAKTAENNIMALAKSIRKDGESFKDAMERAKQELKERKEKSVQKQKTELQKLYELVKTKKELQGFANSDIRRDSVRDAKPRGARVVTKEGFTSNQYGQNFPNKLGRKYWETRDNHGDRLSPNYPKDMPLLEKGGSISSIDVKAGARFKNDMGNIFVIDEVKDGVVKYHSEKFGKEKYKNEINHFIEIMESQRAEKFDNGGSVSNERMYNLLKDDLQELEEAIKTDNNEEIERFFSYWLGSSGHLKSLKTKNNKRMFNFLEEDLEKLQDAISNGDNEEVERFFSYWGQHLESLKFANGGSLPFMTDPNFGNFQNTVLENGGKLDGSMIFYENDYRRLVEDRSEDYPFFSVKTGSYWEVKKEKDESTVAKWFPKNNILKLNKKQDQDLVDWLYRNSYLSQEEYSKFELGGMFMNTDLAGHTGGGTGGLDPNSPLNGFSGTHYTGLVGETGAMSSGELFENGGGVEEWKKAVTIKRNTRQEAERNKKLLQEYWGKSGRNFKVEKRDDKYVVTYEFCSTNKMESGGAMTQNQQVINDASQSYVNYYLGEGAGQGIYKDGGSVDGFDLVYEKSSKMMGGNGVKGSIRTTPHNYYVATIDNNGDILFEDLESKTRGIDKNKVKKLWMQNKIKDVTPARYYDSRDTYKEGGSIPNNYKGRTPEDIWDNWTKKQREHFLADHYDVLNDKSDLNSKDKLFDDLDFGTKTQLMLHLKQGQYANGGMFNTNVHSGTAFMDNASFADGGFMNDVYAKGGELQGKFLAEIKVPYNYEDVVKDEFEFTEFLSKSLTKKWFGNGVWGVTIVKPLFEKDYSQRIVVEIEIPVGVTQGGGLDKFDVGEFISKILTKKWFGNGVWGVDIVSSFADGGMFNTNVHSGTAFMDNASFADGGFMNNVYAKGGFTPTIEFNVGDVVWQKDEKRYATVMNNYGDPVNGDRGEVRLDTTGNTIIFNYNKDYSKKTGYNLVKLGENGNAGNFTSEVLSEMKESANRLIELRRESKDKNGVAYYQEVYKRLLDGEFDSMAKGSVKPTKYIDHDDIKSVTLKLKGKTVTIAGSDVLNGANLMEKGGNLGKIANYVPKRDVVSVQLKNGETVKPVNGYWVKNEAKPINEDDKIEVVYERVADFKKKPVRLVLLQKGREQKGFTFSGKDQVAILENYNRNKQEDLEKLWNLKGYETKFADGGMFDDNDGFMRMTNGNNYRYPNRPVHVDTIDEPIDLKDNVSTFANEVVIQPLNEDIDLSENSRLRARVGYNPKDRSPEKMLSVNPRAYGFMDLPKPTSSQHKND